MLIVALVLAVVSLAALVTAVVTSNEAIAWACIGFSALGVVLLIVDAIRDRHHRAAAPSELASDSTEVIAPVETDAEFDEDELPEGVPSEGELAEDEVPDEEFADEQDSAAELVDYPAADDLIAVEDHPDEVVHDEPDYDIPSDDEPSYPVPAEEAAIHTVGEDDILADHSATPVTYEVTYEPSADADHSTTVIYSGEPYTDESSTGTESYIVITDEPDTVADAGEPEDPREPGSDSER